MVTVRARMTPPNLIAKTALAKTGVFGMSSPREVIAAKRSHAFLVSYSLYAPPQLKCNSFSVIFSIPSTSVQMRLFGPSIRNGSSVYLAPLLK